MRILEIIENGVLSIEDTEYFGGRFSLWENLKRGGVGSPKIIYQSGIEEFDKIKRNVEGEIGFVNFELMKNGLILRLNINQRMRCVGLRLDEIEAINLVAYRIAVTGIGKNKSKNIFRGELELLDSGNSMKFLVHERDFKGLKNFFQKDELADKFNFMISENLPGKSN